MEETAFSEAINIWVILVFYEEHTCKALKSALEKMFKLTPMNVNPKMYTS